MDKFFEIPAGILFKNELSPNAKLLLVYLICLKDTPNFMISLDSIEKLYGGHRTRLVAGMKELKNKGILVTERTRKSNGKWGQILYKLNMEYFNNDKK